MLLIIDLKFLKLDNKGFVLINYTLCMKGGALPSLAYATSIRIKV